MAITLPKIIKCSVTDCAYNKDNKCHTLAITVGDASHAACDTFFKTSHKGGSPDLMASVGACKVENCRHNKSLECSASGINVGLHSNHADCQTFSAR